MGMLDEPDAVDLLARLVAGSVTFQQAIGQDGAELADEHVHRMLVIKPEDVPRPWALVEFGDLSSKREAGGERNIYSFDAFLLLTICGEMSLPQDPEKSLRDFTRFAYNVFFDIHELGGYDDNLNFSGAEQEQRPTFTAETSGKNVRWCMTSWRVPYGTF